MGVGGPVPRLNCPGCSRRASSWGWRTQRSSWLHPQKLTSWHDPCCFVDLYPSLLFSRFNSLPPYLDPYVLSPFFPGSLPCPLRSALLAAASFVFSSSSPSLSLPWSAADLQPALKPRHAPNLGSWNGGWLAGGGICVYLLPRRRAHWAVFLLRSLCVWWRWCARLFVEKSATAGSSSCHPRLLLFSCLADYAC
jgi:hypothetical protein